jgi:hypothetical protein
MPNFNPGFRPDPLLPGGDPLPIPPSRQPQFPGSGAQPDSPKLTHFEDMPEISDLPPGQVVPELPLWQPPPTLDELVDQTVTQLQTPHRFGEEQHILHHLVSELNRADVVLTSYPPKPVYNHSEAELQQQADKLQQRIARLDGSERTGFSDGPGHLQTEREACQTALKGIQLALTERHKPIEFQPPKIELL